MVIFEKIRFKNFLSYGNTFTEIPLNVERTTLSTGVNGQGKCVHPSTKIDIIFDDPATEKLFKEFLS
jgi:hypothetical protein